MTIRPRVCDLAWAKGKVPTPHGDVEVAWTWAENKIALNVTVPPGTQADVVLPDKSKRVSAGHYQFKSVYPRMKPEPTQVANDGVGRN